MSVYKPKNSPFYHFDFQFRGNRFCGSTGCAAKKEALRFEAQQRLNATRPPEKKVITLQDAASDYFRRKIIGISTEGTVETHIDNLLKALGAGSHLSDITEQDIMRAQAKWRARVSNATVNRRTQTLRAIYNFARVVLKRETGEPIEWKALMLKEPEPPQRELSDDAEVKLFGELRPDYRPLFLFALMTGRRISAARGLKWADVNPEALSYTVREKGKAAQSFAMTRTILALLMSQPRGCDEVFTYARQRTQGGFKRGDRCPFTRDGWRREWYRVTRTVGLEGFRVHDLRHTAATRMLRATGNLGAVQKALGHSTPAMTMRYAHVLDDDVRGALEAMEGKTGKVKEVKE